MLFFAVVSDIVGRKKLSGRELGGFIYGRMPMRLHSLNDVNAFGIHSWYVFISADSQSQLMLHFDRLCG